MVARGAPAKVRKRLTVAGCTGPAGRRAIAALALLLAVAPHARAARDCQTAFEKWSILSTARVRVLPQGASGRGACVPNEATRRELLDGLARARGLCVSALPADTTVQQTQVLLGINEAFIASLAVCPADSDPGTGWVTKSDPDAQKPKVAAPLPAPPRPAVAAPPRPQKPTVVAPPPTPPPAPAPTPPCLEVSPAKEEHYALVNRRCRGHTVLAVIETRGSAGEVVCRGYSISQSVTVRASRAAPPRVNHECVLDQGRCSEDRLGNMFPECDWQ